MKTFRTLICFFIAALCVLLLCNCSPGSVDEELLLPENEDAVTDEPQTAPAMSLPVDQLSEDENGGFSPEDLFKEIISRAQQGGYSESFVIDDFHFGSEDIGQDELLGRLYGLFGGGSYFGGDGAVQADPAAPGYEWSGDGLYFDLKDIDEDEIEEKLRGLLGDGFYFNFEDIDEDEIEEKLRGFFGDGPCFNIEDIDEGEIEEKLRGLFGDGLSFDDEAAFFDSLNDKIREFVPDFEIVPGEEGSNILLTVRAGGEIYCLSGDLHILHFDADGNAITGGAVDQYIDLFNGRVDALREYFESAAGTIPGSDPV